MPIQHFIRHLQHSRPLTPLYLSTCRGRNTEGQCGVDDKAVASEPVVVRNLDTHLVSSVAAGRVHSAAVLKTGEVLTWGCGKAGKLGHGSTDNFSHPTT